MNPQTGLCEKCGSEMWNNASKNAERVAEGLKPMPLYSCKNKACGNVVWPPRDGKPAPVAQYNHEPSFSKQSIPHPPARDFEAEATGKVRHAFALEAYKAGKPLDTKTVTEINEWTAFVMSGKLNKDLDI